VVVIEDLVSTANSSLQAVDALRREGLSVIGLVSIFNYGFETAKKALEKAEVPTVSLSDYATLISLALEKELVTPEEERVLLRWSADPAGWAGE